MKWLPWISIVLLLHTLPMCVFADQNSPSVQPEKSNSLFDNQSKNKEISQPDVTSGLLQVTMGLFVVLLIIAGAAWLTRRFGNFQISAGGNLRVIGGLHLSAREKLVVVQVGEEQLLLGVAPGRVSTLHVLGQPLDTHLDHKHVSSNFLDKLNTALKGNRS